MLNASANRFLLAATVVFQLTANGIPANAADLGDQTYLFKQAKNHWAFQPIRSPQPPTAPAGSRTFNTIDQFVLAKAAEKELSPSSPADPRTLVR